MHNIQAEINRVVKAVSKTEAWKYTKLYDLKDAAFTFESKLSKDVFPDVGIEAYFIKFLNGKLVSIDKNMPEEVVINEKNKGENISLDKYPFAQINNQNENTGIQIVVKKGFVCDRPIFILNKTNSEDLYYNLNNSITVNDKANIEIVEHYIYSGNLKSKYFVNAVNNIHVLEGAVLKHYKVQEEAYKATHMALNIVDVEASGVYESICLQTGANIARNETVVNLKNQNASCNINAAYIMNGWATIDTTNDVRHLSPYTYSDQLIKGVISGEAKGVFQGKIHIAKNAVKTNGYMLHKALLLSDEAEVDCKPELEIFADDVKCSHGAATGVLDEMQLFYMTSRGISIEDAKQMLIDAYLDDVLNKISNNKIYNWVKDRI